MVHECTLLPYPPQEAVHDAREGLAAEAAPAEVALALALSEFHLLLLYPSSVLAVSRLNHQVACRVWGGPSSRSRPTS